MKKSRHTDEQIVKILREADETTIAETDRKHSITDPLCVNLLLDRPSLS